VLHNHDPPLVHRDIKSLNLLLDVFFNIKVCDFGLSRQRTLENVDTLIEVRSTAPYCPPEVFQGELFSAPSDIYSIGMVMWEVMMRVVLGEYHRPYAEFQEITHDIQILIMASQQKRPTIPPTCPLIIADLIRSCWHQSPDSRPTSSNLIQTLHDLLQSYKKNPDSIAQPTDSINLSPDHTDLTHDNNNNDSYSDHGNTSSN